MAIYTHRILQESIDLAYHRIVSRLAKLGDQFHGRAGGRTDKRAGGRAERDEICFSKFHFSHGATHLSEITWLDYQEAFHAVQHSEIEDSRESFKGYQREEVNAAQ